MVSEGLQTAGDDFQRAARIGGHGRRPDQFGRQRQVRAGRVIVVLGLDADPRTGKAQVRKAAKLLFDTELMGSKRMREIVRWAEKR